MYSFSKLSASRSVLFFYLLNRRWALRAERGQRLEWMSLGGEVVQYVADPWHTCHLHFPRCSLSRRSDPSVPLLSLRHRFVCPYNLPAKETTQVVPSQWRFAAPLHPLSRFFLKLAASSCVSWLPASSPPSSPSMATQRDTSLAEINLF